jgi:hypothetical protein
MEDLVIIEMELMKKKLMKHLIDDKNVNIWYDKFQI